MIVIYTGNNEIDKMIEEGVKNSMIVSYADFIIEDDKFKEQTVILAVQAIEESKLTEYLFQLRSLNIRVILIVKDQKQEVIKTALSMGIYDFIFGNFYISEIQELVNNRQTFADISQMYKKQFNIKVKNKRKGRKRT